MHWALFYFNGCFYCILKVCHFDSVGFTFLKLFDDILFEGLLGDSLLVGFDLVGFAFELEFYDFTLDEFAVDFKLGL